MIPKIVKKHWGEELWIADGVRTPYASKLILFLAGKRTSLQVHEHKFETNYVLSGTGILYKSKYVLDIADFKLNGLTEDQVNEYEATFDLIELHPGVIFDMLPGFVHRVEAISDLKFIETSTCELDDVIRLQDDCHRTHGRISHEHSDEN